jgi:hypothetical protein
MGGKLQHAQQPYELANETITNREIRNTNTTNEILIKIPTSITG